MTRRQMIALAVVLAVLVIARIVLHSRQGASASHASQAGLGRVLPKEIEASSVRWIRVSGPVTAGDQPAAAPALELVRGADGWTLASAESAAADAVAIDDFLSRALALQGEVRGEGEAAWPRFGLDPVSAVKVELGGEPHDALATIWLGKQGDSPDAHFVRAEGADAIRHVRDGLRGPLGLWGATASPAPDQFLQKAVVDLEAKDVAKLVIERPDATFVVEKGQGEPPAWAVSAPAMPWIVQADSLDGVVSRAAKVRVTRVLPAGTAACDAPGAGSATFTRAEGETRVSVGGAPEGAASEVALRVSGAAPCYSLASFSVATLLPRASALWSIPQVFFEMASADPPSRVRWQRGRDTLDMTRDGETWSLSGRTKGDAARLSRVAKAFHELRVDDVAELARVPADRLAVEATLTAQIGSRAAKLEVLGERAGSPGERYVRVSGGTTMPDGWIAVISSATAESLLPTADELRGSADAAIEGD